VALLVVVALFVAAIPALAEPTGNEVLVTCQTAIRFIDNNGGPAGEHFDSGWCIGRVTSALQLTKARNERTTLFKSKPTTLQFCVPDSRLCIVGIFVREKADPAATDFQLEITIGGQQLFAGPFNVNFAQQLTARSIAEMHGLVVPSPGTLGVSLRHEGRVIGHWSAAVNQDGQAAMQMFLPPLLPPPRPV
jgi:hypothetical protein